MIELAEGLCQACLRKDPSRVTLGTDVHHKVSKAEGKRRGWTPEQIDDLSNLELLCRACHDEADAAVNGRVYRAPTRVALDGTLIDG